jgi:hypothetical protein
MDHGNWKVLAGSTRQHFPFTAKSAISGAISGCHVQCHTTAKIGVYRHHLAVMAVMTLGIMAVGLFSGVYMAVKRGFVTLLLG